VDGKHLTLQYLLKQTGFAKHPTTQSNRLRLQRLSRQRVTASSVTVSVWWCENKKVPNVRPYRSHLCKFNIHEHYCSFTEIDITMYRNCTAKITCTEIDLICTEVVMYGYCPSLYTESDIYRKWHNPATAMWLGGWVYVTCRYCIKMAKPILKLFRPSGSPIILVSANPMLIPNSKGNPFSGVLNTRGWVGKIDNFRRKSPFISEPVGDRPMVTMER